MKNILTLAAIMASTSVALSQTLVNGSFENGTFGNLSGNSSELDPLSNSTFFITGSPTYTGWNTTNLPFGHRGPTTDGVTALVLTPGGVASQVVSLGAGTYSFEFDTFNVKHTDGSSEDFTARIRDAATSAVLAGGALSELSNGAATSRALTVTLSSAQDVVLEFGGTTGSVAVDNVSASPVPEPTSLLTLFAGCGLFATRRRR